MVTYKVGAKCKDECANYCSDAVEPKTFYHCVEQKEKDLLEVGYGEF